jgi:hypothetical protein
VADAVGNVTLCGMCSKLYCVSCMDPFDNHNGMGDAHCANVRAAKRRRLLDIALPSATHQRKPCPKCMTMIDKEPNTCNSVRCPNCMLHYCFLCLKITAVEGVGEGKFNAADANEASHAHMHADARAIYGARSAAFWRTVDENATPNCHGRMWDESGATDRLVPEA